MYNTLCYQGNKKWLKSSWCAPAIVAGCRLSMLLGQSKKIMFTCCRRKKLLAWTRDRSAWKVARISGAMLRIALTVGLIPRSRVPYAASTSVRWCWSRSRFPWAFDLARNNFSSSYHPYIPQEFKLCWIYYSLPTANAWFWGELFEAFYQLIIMKPPMTLSFTNLTNHDFVGGLSDSDWHSTEVRQTLLWSEGSVLTLRIAINCSSSDGWIVLPVLPVKRSRFIILQKNWLLQLATLSHWVLEWVAIFMGDQLIHSAVIKTSAHCVLRLRGWNGCKTSRSSKDFFASELY